MSIAKNLGDYLASIVDDAAASVELGARLDRETEQPAYANAIKMRARTMATISLSELDGHKIYNRVLKVIDHFASNRGCGTGITTSKWHQLKTLALTLGKREDWAYLTTGPIYASTNQALADRMHLSEQRTRKVLKELCQFGLIIYHDRLANGRRTHRRDSEGNPYGHGLSLLPLIVRLRELEEHARAFIEKAKKAISLKRQAQAALRAARRLVTATTADTRHPAHAAIDDVGKQVVKAFKHRNAGELEAIVSDLQPNQTTLRGVENDPSHITSQPPCESLVGGVQEARSGNGGAKDPTEDPFGLVAAAFTPKEIPILFPVAELAIDGSRDLVEVAQKLARMTGLDERMFAKAKDKLGPIPASTAVLVYAQHLADGEVRNVQNPQSYFAGMLNAADRRDLNLGATIWGRREATGTNHNRSQVAQ